MKVFFDKVCQSLSALFYLRKFCSVANLIFKCQACLPRKNFYRDILNFGRPFFNFYVFEVCFDVCDVSQCFNFSRFLFAVITGRIIILNYLHSSRLFVFYVVRRFCFSH